MTVGKVGIVNRTATPSDLERLLPLLDRQFVYDKNRSLSLALRFPSVFCPANADNIFLCEENGVILSALAVRRFDWRENEQVWRGAMVGAVYTDPQRRGEGLASGVLKWVAGKLRESGVDFAVLWTAQPAFYARLGWVAADGGMLGEAAGSSGAAMPANDVTTISMVNADPLQLEDIRSQWLTSILVRRPEDYRQIPVPAESVDVLLSNAGDQERGYALVGSVGETGIVYEMVGDEKCFPALFSQVCARYRRVLVNDCRGSPSHRWLTRNTGIAWQDKPLAMWMALSDKLEMARIKRWYIPYFDRI